MAKAALIAALGMVAAAQSAPLAMLPLLMDALALGADRLGVAIAAGLLVTLVLAPPAGRLADRVPAALVARCGLAIICAASIALCGLAALCLGGVLPLAAAFPVLFATRIANGAGVAALHPAAQAWLWAGVEEDRGARLQGHASAAQNAGRFLGPLGVALVSGWGLVGAMAALAGLAAVALLLLCLTPGLGRGASPPRAAESGAGAGPSARTLRRLLGALLALHVLGGGAQFMLGPLLMQRIGLDAAQATGLAGLLMALAAAASIAGNLAARFLPRRRRLMLGAGVTLSGAVLLAPFPNAGLVAAGVAVLAFGIGLAVPAAMSELLRQAPQSRGRVAGRAAATQAAAYAIAAPVFGVLCAIDPWLAAAALPVPAAAFLALAMLGSRISAEGPTPRPLVS